MAYRNSGATMDVNIDCDFIWETNDVCGATIDTVTYAGDFHWNGVCAEGHTSTFREDQL